MVERRVCLLTEGKGGLVAHFEKGRWGIATRIREVGRTDHVEQNHQETNG